MSTERLLLLAIFLILVFNALGTWAIADGLGRIVRELRAARGERLIREDVLREPLEVAKTTDSREW